MHPRDTAMTLCYDGIFTSYFAIVTAYLVLLAAVSI